MVPFFVPVPDPGHIQRILYDSTVFLTPETSWRIILKHQQTNLASSNFQTATADRLMY
ncbi:predicted protein [Botrytis cinerea T4]|uniref:Uncharacterized protein n=1 Tax=Botryotinia fuckeliana (strain T4) TaxID=999810 RepID=G2Y9M1_BOTF4|nr:predicted protein [Botrytis cinerea T4]